MHEDLIQTKCCVGGSQISHRPRNHKKQKKTAQVSISSHQVFRVHKFMLGNCTDDAVIPGYNWLADNHGTTFHAQILEGRTWVP